MVVTLRDDSSVYFRWGPSDSLLLVSAKLNTWFRWCAAMAVIALLRGVKVVVNEIGSLILGFNVYNPDKKVITEFTKNELNVITNCMWMCNSLRGIFTTIVAVTQVDLALGSVLVSEIVSFFTVRHLLSEKQFAPSGFQEIQVVVDV